MTSLQPKLISFLITFLLIGIYWMRHLRVFRYIKRFNARLLILNLLFLFSIVILPFTSNLVGSYAQLVMPIVLYALNAAAVGFLMHIIWWYASSGHQLIDASLPRPVIRSISAGSLGSPISFLISIPVAYINPQWAPVVWWILPASSTLILMRLGRRR